VRYVNVIVTESCTESLYSSIRVDRNTTGSPDRRLTASIQQQCGGHHCLVHLESLDHCPDGWMDMANQLMVTIIPRLARIVCPRATGQ
jgi:hypothetical protein